MAQLRGHVPKDRSLMQQSRAFAASDRGPQGGCDATTRSMTRSCTFSCRSYELKCVAEPVAQQKRPQPAFSGSGWKVSLKRVDEKIRVEGAARWPGLSRRPVSGRLRGIR